MGIPNLLTTLAPFSQPAHLDNRHVVIDGPALAYHILHKCVASGYLEPSYELLSNSAIAWLDTLRHHNISVEAIYFDAFLPPSKRPTRIDRVQKSTAHLVRLSTKCPHGLPMPALAPSSLDSASLFDISGQSSLQKHYPLQPPFLVPSIIDALNGSDSYRDLLHLVPGEADDFCARHKFQATPACILTSDSDLLVHDLPDDTGVVFLRDIYSTSDGYLSCALFTPADISAQFEVPCTRLAYERERLPQATVNQLRRICLEESPDDTLYRLFCRRYAQSEKGNRRVPWDFRALDPRLSELIYQLSDASSPEPDIFIPTLTENPSRRSAWEPSLDLRSMGYTFAALACKSRQRSLREHRKIQNSSQHKGTNVKLSVRTSRLFMDDLLLLLKRCKRYGTLEHEPVWLLVCLAIDVQYHVKAEKRSCLLEMLRNPERPSQKCKLHSWELVHVTAHFLATLYSLRLVDQILNALPPGVVDVLPTGLLDVKDHISWILPPLKSFPDIAAIAGLLFNVKLVETLRTRLNDILGLDEEEEECGDGSIHEIAKFGKKVTNQAKQITRKSNNPFDLLSDDQ